MSSTSLAPIALFVYNRPDHVRRTIDALQLNMGAEESELHVFSDGARDQSAVQGVSEVREYLSTIRGFRKVEIVERDRNFGLAGSIVDGVTALCEKHGRVIVMEDDLVTSPWFLRYMADGLHVFENEDLVASIHGYRFPIGDAPRNFFLYGADCWGWATWQRAWKAFNPDARSLLSQLRAHPARKYFDYLGTWPHTSMLRGFLNGKNNSWAIRWHASMFLAGKLTLHPSRSLVNNIGMDGSGTHCSADDGMATLVSDVPIPVENVPLEHSREQWHKFRNYSVAQVARRAVRRLIPN